MKLLSFLLLLFVLAGCSDSDTTTTSSNNGSEPTSDLFGTVNLLDYRGRQIQDKSGVLVKCEGTSFSALTDTGGNWIIHNLPTRTYNIGFSKEGFYSFHDPIFTFVAGAPVRYYGSRGNYFESIVTIGQPPRYTITLDGLSMPKYYFDSVKGYVTTNGALYLHTSDDTPNLVFIGILLIAGTNPSLNIEDKTSYSFSRLSSETLYTAHDSSLDISFILGYQSPPVNQIPEGQTLYIRAYPKLTTAQQYDPFTDKSEFIGYGQGSNILSAIKK